MLDRSDIKALVGFSDRTHLIYMILMYVGLLIFLFSLGNNIYLAIQYANIYGLDLSETLELWNAEPKLNESYTGYEVQSSQRLNMAIVNLGIVILITINIWSAGASRRRNKRIYEELAKCSAINEVSADA